MNYVKCEYCGRIISAPNIKKHLNSHKNGNFDKYNVKTYHLDHDDLVCKFCGKECKNKNSLVQHELRCKDNPNRKAVYAEGFNFNVVDRIAWNKGLTKETNTSLKAASEKLKKLIKEKGYSGCYGLKGSKNKSCNPDIRLKISQTCLNKSKNGKWHTSVARSMHYCYKGIDLHGTWELRYAIFLDNLNIRWERPKVGFEYNFQNKNHYYTPDFYLVDFDTYIEIKGFKRDIDIIKWKEFRKKNNLIVLEYDDLSKIGIFDIDVDYNKFKLNKSTVKV